jgi:fibronectin-binding autotransporter adhesin
LSVNTLANGGAASNIGQSANAAANLTFYNGGILQYTGLTASTDRAFTLNVSTSSGGGFDVTQAGTALTVSGAGAGAGQLIKNGPGTLILAGANTFTGGTTINAGTLQISGTNRLPQTGTVTFTGGTLDLDGFMQTVNALASVSGAGVITTSVAGGVALWVGNGGGSGTYSGIIQDGSGTIGLTKVGAGTQTLTGTNTYTAGTDVLAGVLALGSAGAIGTTGTIRFDGGTLQFSAANTTDYSPRLSIDTNQAYRLDTNGQAVTLASALTSLGGSLTKLGPGTLTVTAANTYTGPTQVNGGILSVAALANGGVASPIGQSSNAATNLTFANGGILQYTGPTVSTDRGFTLNTGGGGFDVNQAGTTLTLSGAGTGSGGFIKSGPGTLILTGANVYTGGTTINAGTLQVGAGGATGALGSGNVTDNGSLVYNLTSNATLSGAISGTGGVSQTGTGTLTLTGTNTYSGGTTISAGILQVGPGALGSGAVVDNTTLAFSVSSSATQSNLISGPGGISKLGSGALTLTGANTYTGPTAVSAGSLVAGSSSAFGVNSAVMLSAGATVSVNGNNVAVGSLAGTGTVNNNANTAATLTVGSDNTSTTFAGLITDGTGYPLAVAKVGTGMLTLTGRVANTGGCTATGGMLELSGALVQPGPSSLTAAAGATIQYDSGAQVYGGFLRGAGTHVVTGGATLSGVTTLGSTVVSQTGAGSFVNFANGGSYSLAAGLATPAVFNGFSNEGSGSITVGAVSKVNAADFQTYGTLTLNPAVVGSGQFTELVNTGSSPLYFNGGSRTFLGTPATANFNGSPTFVAGFDLNGKNAVVAGGLFVNNGFVVDSSNMGTGTATIVADFGALVKGAGFFQNPVITQNGGRVQAGNSPGTASFGRFVFGPGGVSNYVFAIDEATGTAGPSPDAAGHVSGWGLVKAVRQSFGSATTSGDFTWTGTPTNKLTVAIDTLVNPTTVGTDIAGPMADFDPTRAYSWPAAHWAGTYSGPTDAVTLNAATSFDTSGFLNPIAGTFGWSLDPAGQTLSLVYTPTAVPEPGTLALLGAVAAAGWCRRWLARRGK